MPLLRQAQAARAAASLIPLLLAGALAPAEPVAREARVVMGTLCEVQAAGLAEPAQALAAAFAALDLVDRQMSLFHPSDLTRLNAAGAGRVPPELLAVLRHARAVFVDSGGAFDPTAEPRRRSPRGMQRVHLEADGRVRLEPGTRVDLGGIAKGYAADLAVAALRGAGATAGLVDLGGSSLAVFGDPLTVEVRAERSGSAWAVFEVRGAQVSTSGGSEQPGHILDPRTGRPARSGLLAAAVVASAGIEADALSTAVFVMGAADGLALLERRGAAGLVLLMEKGRRVVRSTAGFAERFALDVAPGVKLNP